MKQSHYIIYSNVFKINKKNILSIIDGAMERILFEGVTIKHDISLYVPYWFLLRLQSAYIYKKPTDDCKLCDYEYGLIKVKIDENMANTKNNYNFVCLKGKNEIGENVIAVIKCVRG